MNWSQLVAGILVPILTIAIPLGVALGFIGLCSWVISYASRRARILPYLSVPLALTLLFISGYLLFAWEMKVGESHGANLSEPFIVLPVMAIGVVCFVFAIALIIGTTTMPKRLLNKPNIYKPFLIWGVVLALGALILNFLYPFFPWYPFRVVMMVSVSVMEFVSRICFVLAAVVFGWNALEKKRRASNSVRSQIEPPK